MCTCNKSPIDALDETVNKLTLITDLISLVPENQTLELGGKSLTGLCYFLVDAEIAIEAVLALHEKKA